MFTLYKGKIILRALGSGVHRSVRGVVGGRGDMTKLKNFDELRRKLRSDPQARARVENHRLAMRDALALADLRVARSATQVELAQELGVSQANVSRVEHQTDLYLSTLREYVAALGGKLEIRAIFPDETVTLDVARPED